MEWQPPKASQLTSALRNCAKCVTG